MPLFLRPCVDDHHPIDLYIISVRGGGEKYALQQENVLHILKQAIQTADRKDGRLCRKFVFTLRISIIYPEDFGEFRVVEAALSVCERAREESLNLQRRYQP